MRSPNLEIWFCIIERKKKTEEKTYTINTHQFTANNKSVNWNSKAEKNTKKNSSAAVCWFFWFNFSFVRKEERKKKNTKVKLLISELRVFLMHNTDLWCKWFLPTKIERKKNKKKNAWSYLSSKDNKICKSKNPVWKKWWKSDFFWELNKRVTLQNAIANKLISITTNEDNDLKTNCESQCVEKKKRIECVHKANVVFMKKKNLPTDQYSES